MLPSSSKGTAINLRVSKNQVWAQAVELRGKTSHCPDWTKKKDPEGVRHDVGDGGSKISYIKKRWTEKAPKTERNAASVLFFCEDNGNSFVCV